MTLLCLLMWMTPTLQPVRTVGSDHSGMVWYGILEFNVPLHIV